MVSLPRLVSAASLLALGLLCNSPGAAAIELMTGVNVPNATRADPAERAEIIQQLSAARVHVVRFPFGPNDSDIDYVAALQSRGIKVDLILAPQFPPNAPMRPAYAPNAHMYPGHPLSSADPDLSRTHFQEIMAKLDARHVALAGIELGNEINWSAFNADFPLPGEGKIFGTEDLLRDPEGQQVARGFLQYIRLLGILKEVRDHSASNRTTPIISAGLSPTGRARNLPKPTGDGASIEATLEFLQQHGLNNFVDGYGIHFYPWQPKFEQTDQNLRNNVVAKCGPRGSGNLPCWVTEWGVLNQKMDCPLDEGPRLPMIAHMMDDFRGLAAQGRVRAAFYYSWNTDPRAGNRVDPIQLYRCGGITEAGRIALTP